MSTVRKLKSELRKRGLSTSGAKKMLIERLQKAEVNPSEILENQQFDTPRNVKSDSSIRNIVDQFDHDSGSEPARDEKNEISDYQQVVGPPARSSTNISSESIHVTSMGKQTHRVVHSQQQDFRPDIRANQFNRSLSVKDIVELLPHFDPSSFSSQTASQFIRNVMSIKEVYNIPDELILIAFAQRLHGSAVLWYRSVQFKIRSLEQFADEFMENFGSMYTEVDVHEKLRNHVRPKT